MDLRRRRARNEQLEGFYAIEPNVTDSRIEEVIFNPALDNVSTFGDICFFLGDKKTHLPYLKLYPGPNAWVVSCTLEFNGRVKTGKGSPRMFSIIPDVTPDLWFYIPYSFFISNEEAIETIYEFSNLESSCISVSPNRAKGILDDWTKGWQVLLEENQIDMEQDIRMDGPTSVDESRIG
jgi:hypothetical protein